MDKDIEIRKLELEERRLDEELQLRKKELELQHQQFEANQKKKGVLAQIFSPVGVAVIAAIIGLFGTAASGLINSYTESKKQEASLILKTSEIADEKQRARNLLFFDEVGYLNFPPKYKEFLRETAGLKEGQQVPPPSTLPTTLIEIPKNLNQDLTQAKYETLMEIFGPPCNLTLKCEDVINENLKRLMVTEDIGTFRVKGLKPVVDALRRVFSDIKQQKPELYERIISAGGLCCRRDRNALSKFSTHSWGIAIDLAIDGEFDTNKDQKTQSGLVELYPFFNKEKFFWGAESKQGESSQHFEASNEMIMEWQKTGILSQQ